MLCAIHINISQIYNRKQCFVIFLVLWYYAELFYLELIICKCKVTISTGLAVVNTDIGRLCFVASK